MKMKDTSNPYIFKTSGFTKRNGMIVFHDDFSVKFYFAKAWNNLIHKRLPWRWLGFRYQYNRMYDGIRGTFVLFPCEGDAPSLEYTFEELVKDKKARAYFEGMLVKPGERS